MRKASLVLGFFILSLFLLSFVSAGYSYNYPERYYSYPEYNNQRVATYSDEPTIKDRVRDSSEKNSFYNREYQGPVMQKDVRYDEFLKIGKSGRVTKTVSYQTSERYVGSLERESKGSSDSRLYEKDYSSVPTKSEYYEETSFKYSPSYSPGNYGNGYRDNYYYSPRYSNGYYNWRY